MMHLGLPHEKLYKSIVLVSKFAQKKVGPKIVGPFFSSKTLRKRASTGNCLFIVAGYRVVNKWCICHHDMGIGQVVVSRVSNVAITIME